MIKPTNGRVVLYTPAKPTNDFDSDKAIEQHDSSVPLTALVVHVWGDRMVNLVVFDSNGNSHQRTSVTLLQDDDLAPEWGRYAEWMTYQKGQAAKAEELAEQLRQSQLPNKPAYPAGDPRNDTL